MAWKESTGWSAGAQGSSTGAGFNYSSEAVRDRLGDPQVQVVPNKHTQKFYLGDDNDCGFLKARREDGIGIEFSAIVPCGKVAVIGELAFGILSLAVQGEATPRVHNTEQGH